MIIAEHLKNKNIAEYILYMWQTEDLIRSYNLDINLINEKIVLNLSTDNDDQKDNKIWYAKIIKDLKIQGKQKIGHLNDIEEVINELNYLHSTLINLMQDPKYTDIFKKALPFINDFRNKTKDEDISEVHLCLNAIYGKLILKLKGSKISDETEEAFEEFRNVLAYISVKYKEMKAGSLNL